MEDMYDINPDTSCVVLMVKRRYEIIKLEDITMSNDIVSKTKVGELETIEKRLIGLSDDVSNVLGRLNQRKKMLFGDTPCKDTEGKPENTPQGMVGLIQLKISNLEILVAAVKSTLVSIEEL